MNANRKSTLMMLILGASAGCAGGDDAAPPPPGPSAPAAVSRPAAPPVKKDDMSKGGTSSEMTPPPASPAAGKKGDEAPKIEGPKAGDAKPEAGAVKLTADELAGIKELPAAEQAAATAQAVCPVSAENLGSMGKPLKVTALGKTFYLCCKSCEPKLKADPKGYVAKLDKK
ncbi:MAG: hypothetical protein ACHRXM_09365 [Isosphaerales bacterium]